MPKISGANAKIATTYKEKLELGRGGSGLIFSGFLGLEKFTK
jgi:hypothetical protein